MPYRKTFAYVGDYMGSTRDVVKIGMPYKDAGETIGHVVDVSDLTVTVEVYGDEPPRPETHEERMASNHLSASFFIFWMILLGVITMAVILGN